MAHAADGISGHLQFLRDHFELHSQSEIMARSLITDMLYKYYNYNSDFIQIMTCEVIALVDSYMERYQMGDFFTSWDFRTFVMQLHNKIQMAVASHPDLSVTIPMVPSKYITLVHLVLFEYVQYTEYDRQRFDEDDISTCEGSDSDISEEY